MKVAERRAKIRTADFCITRKPVPSLDCGGFPPDILYRLRFVPLAGGFRAGYAYDNVLYNVIGAVVEKVSGNPWQRFISERFFEPLGMNSSLTSVRQIKPGEDAASPHAMADGVLKGLEYMPIDNIAPAGSPVCSAADMARWVMTLLNKGVTPDGKRLLSEHQANVLWTPLVLISGRINPPQELQESNSNFTAYAMGEFISSIAANTRWRTREEYSACIPLSPCCPIIISALSY